MPQTDDHSPLTLIRDKEQELSRRIRAARREAETIVAQAQQRATAIRCEAEHDGLRAAEAYYRQELAQAEHMAAGIEAAGHTQARLLQQAGGCVSGRSVQAIIAFVLPE